VVDKQSEIMMSDWDKPGTDECIRCWKQYHPDSGLINLMKNVHNSTHFTEICVPEWKNITYTVIYNTLYVSTM